MAKNYAAMVQLAPAKLQRISDVREAYMLLMLSIKEARLPVIDSSAEGVFADSISS
jgi:hypothetical protein